MGNEVSTPMHPELNQLQKVLDTNTESYTKHNDNVTSDAQYTITNANIPHYNDYMKAKQTYLAQRNGQRGGNNSFKVGDIVKRKSRPEETEPCELVGKVSEVIEGHEYPIGSGKKLPTMYVINFPELFKGTSNEGAKLVFPCCDLELVYDSSFN